MTLHLSVGILSISGGSLLLLINNYGSVSGNAATFIPHTALGTLLLIAAALSAYAAVSRCLSHAQLFSTLCLSISALWSALGLVHILFGQRILTEDEFRFALIPGLATFSFALFLIAIIATLVKKVVLILISISKVEFLGAGLKDKVVLKAEESMYCDVTIVGLVLNLLSAAILASPLFGVVLNPGHVCWLWTAAVFQIGICVLLFRAMDTLTATFYAFMAFLKFAEGFSVLLNAQPLVSPISCPIAFSVLFSITALFYCSKSLLHGLYQLFYTAYCIAIAAQSSRGIQGVQAAIFVFTVGMILIDSFNMISTSSKRKQGFFHSLAKPFTPVAVNAHSGKDQHEPYLGFSKYADAEVLGHACNLLAAFALTGTEEDTTSLLPWVVVGGGLLQILCGLVAFSRGKTFESTVFVLYGILWAFWGSVRYGSLYGDVRGFNVAVGIICFLLFNFLVTIAALFLSVAWFVYAVTFQLIIVSFLLDAVGYLPYGYDIGVAIIFGAVSLYCFVAKMFSSTFQSRLIPLGKPIIKLSGVGGGALICPHLPARKATSVQQIADIMKNGGVCGIPTDTVYVLVAACNRPEAVVKAYKVKRQAEDRPMSMWISSIKQLQPVRHLLSPLLLDFMEAAWPSSISMVLPRGPWMEVFGLGDAAKHIGTPQSIAIRNPDCAVATHLMNMVGPIAVTSANPTGEADTTHHNQVFAKLGDKVDGVLCDGPSPENIASTVVDCTKIESGQIGFFRVGLIPKSKVLQIFEEVQKRHRHGQINAAFESESNSVTMDNANPLAR